MICEVEVKDASACAKRFALKARAIPANCRRRGMAYRSHYRLRKNKIEELEERLQQAQGDHQREIEAKEADQGPCVLME